MMEKILFVDDECAVLEGYKRALHREFEVDTALGGAEGLAAIAKRGPYAVVISDMRMPEMNGAQFLSKVRTLAPDVTRMLLTGYSDLNAAIEAVNEGNIFRFLSKPCPREAMIAALSAAVEQNRLLSSERELLEKTLMGSIRVLNDVMSAACPEAFGRSQRISRYVQHLMREFKLASPWMLEAAASLSQLGSVTLDPELVQRAYLGGRLTAEQQIQFDQHPERAMKLLSSIPRIEPVAWMIGQQLKEVIPQEVPGMNASTWVEVILGARILKLAVAYEELRMKLASEEFVRIRLRGRAEEFGRDLVEVMCEMRQDPAATELRRIATAMLAPGMLLNQEIRNKQGMLVVAKGQEVTVALLFKLENFLKAGMIDKEVLVYVPL